MVHSKEDYEFAVKASQILFSDSAADDLRSLNEQQLLEIMDGVPTVTCSMQALQQGYPLIDLLTDTSILPSKSEAKKLVLGNGLSINKQKITSIEEIIDASLLLNNKYLLVQKGKKNYYLLMAE